MATWWVAAGCSLGTTDIGDLATEGQTGDETGDSTGKDTTSPAPTDDSTPGESDGTTAPPIDCAGEDCSAGCCEGFDCNFENVCVPCTPEGEELDIDGAGCCEGLVGSVAQICYAPTCDDDGCPEGIAACAPLDLAETSFFYAVDCPPEACLASRTLVLSSEQGDPGLVCTGPDGGDECMASDGAPQEYLYTDGVNKGFNLRFDAAILDGYSTEAFNTLFDSISGILTIPESNPPLIAFISDTTERTPFVYVDGRLQFTLRLALTQAFTRIFSDEKDCSHSDILGQCDCTYEDLGEYEIVVDLEIEAP